MAFFPEVTVVEITFANVVDLTEKDYERIRELVDEIAKRKGSIDGILWSVSYTNPGNSHGDIAEVPCST